MLTKCCLLLILPEIIIIHYEANYNHFHTILGFPDHQGTKLRHIECSIFFLVSFFNFISLVFVVKLLKTKTHSLITSSKN